MLASALLSLTVVAAQPPNVVVIISDDQAWTDFGFMGHHAIETPHLDRLASESVVFTQGHVPSSLCCPSLATIITGRYPFQHGITGNEPPRPSGTRRGDQTYQDDLDAMIDLIDSSPTLPQLLGEAGYRSFQSGKWWLGHHTKAAFTHGMTHGDRKRGGRHGDEGLAIGRSTMQPVFDFIDDSGDIPFFLWYAPMLPHTPHTPPDRLVEKYSAKTESIHVARYWASCEWFDETCGQLLEHLEETGHSKDTIVVFVTDNGWIQRKESRGYAPRSKRSPYEGGIRTPMMIRWPGQLTPATVTRPVSSIDIAPTILAACGLTPPTEMSGVDLTNADLTQQRKAIFGDVYLHNARDVLDPGANLTYRWCIQGRWKLIVPNEANVPDSQLELFDLHDDPQESANLATSNPQRVAELQLLLDAWWSGRSIASNPAGGGQGLEAAITKLAPPNILFILTDDQRWDMIGAITPTLHTPTMDRLAREGCRFQNAFVTTAICAASRASILTGLVERTHQYTFGTPPLSDEFIAQTYPVLLRTAGYRTGFVGKFGVAVEGGARHEMFDSFVSLRPPYLKKQADGTTRHLTEITAEHAIDFLDACPSDEPFCLSVSFNAPHAEDSNPRQYIWPEAMDHLYRATVIPPAPLSDAAFVASQPSFLQDSLNRVRWTWRFDTPEKYQRMVKGYYRMISGVDAAIGHIIDRLEIQGRADNTVIILMGDNGYFLNDRGFAGKWLPYEPSLKVPLIIYDPRAKLHQDSRIVDSIALNIDIAPTIAKLAGLGRPEQMQGRSLVALSRGDAPPKGWRTDFFCEHLMEHRQISKHEGVRTERYRYSRYFEQDPVYEELYDLLEDPLEIRNLADSEEHEQIMKSLRQRCDEMREGYEQAAIGDRGP